MSQSQENLQTEGRKVGQTFNHRTLPVTVEGPIMPVFLNDNTKFTWLLYFILNKLIFDEHLKWYLQK